MHAGTNSLKNWWTRASVYGTLVVLCGLLLMPAPMRAQESTATILGTVVDATGAILPGATVEVKNLDTGVTRTLVTDHAGEFSANLLQIGHYSVTVSMQNFKKFTEDKITLAAGDRTRISPTLALGSLSETVEVTSAPPAVQTDSATVGSLLDTKAVQELPLNGRNVFSLVNLTPGVTAGTGPNGQSLSSGTRPDDRRQSSTYSANGQDPSANNNLIDGVDNNERLIGTIGVRPSIDAIAEVRVQTNLYSADVGRTSGGVVNILTKSGTNQFHGTAFEFLRNDKFDANSYYNFTQSAAAPPIKQEFRQNQFGGSLGGPIFKDKTFFFGDYEGLRTVQGGFSLNVVVPTAAQRVGNFGESCTSAGASFNGSGICSDPTRQISFTSAQGSAPQGPVPYNDLSRAPYSSLLSPIGLTLAGLYPLPSAAAVNSGNYTATGKRTYFGHTFDVKIDHHFNEKNTLRARYSFNNVNVLTPTLFPAVNGINPGSGTSGITGTFPGTNQTRAQNLLLNYTRVLRSNLLLDANASYLRDYINSQNINYGKNISSQLGIPGVNLTDPQTSGLVGVAVSGFQSIGEASFTPLLEIDNSFEYKASVIYTRGNQNIRVGGGFIRRQFNIQQSNGSARGAFTFNPSTASAVAPLANGTPTAATPTASPAGTPNDGAGLANLLIGVPVTITRTITPFVSEYRTWEPNVYVQDDWHARSWLTLNFGVRYDVFTPKTEVRDRISNLNIFTGQVLFPGLTSNRTTGIQTANTNVAPRIGFAATVASGFVIRGGYGISFFPGDINSGALLKNPPFSPSLTCGSSTTVPCSSYGSYGTLAQGLFLPSISYSTTTLASGLPSLSLPAGSGFTEIDQNFRPSYQHQFNVVAEKALGKNTVSVGYVGEVGRNLVMNPADVNRALPSGTSTANPRPITTLNPVIGTVQAFLSAGIGSYNALEVSYQRRLTRGFSANAGYTYAHEIDDVVGLAGTGTNGYGTLIGPQTSIVQNIRAYDRSTGDYNIGNRFFFAGNYEFPNAHVNAILGGAINGWQINGTVIEQSGLPYTVTNLNNVSGIIGISNERPNRTQSAVNLGQRTYSSLGIGYVDPSAFATQSAYTLGNEGRNIASGPSSSSVNMSLFKSFALPESMKLQFRAEFFNLPNHRNYGQPVTTLGSSNFGRINSLSAADTPRQIQFALKLEF